MNTRWRAGAHEGKEDTKKDGEERGKINGVLCRAAR